jgi:signal transduction histidine kinase
MNGILGFSSLLKEPNLSGKKQQEYIEIIEKSGNRMMNIINDIVDISKIHSGVTLVSKNEVNLNEQISNIYDRFYTEAASKGLIFNNSNKLSTADAVIKTDVEKVSSILKNLVKNAIKYTQEGFVEVGCERKGKNIEFHVKDTGIGIPKDRQEAIFERFVQADIEDKMAWQGAGLGLAITKAYVELLGGKIWLESDEGKGSTFYFTLPVH